jgi:hypothetical protein
VSGIGDSLSHGWTKGDVRTISKYVIDYSNEYMTYTDDEQKLSLHRVTYSQDPEHRSETTELLYAPAG